MTAEYNEMKETAKARKARRALEAAVIVARDVMAGDPDFGNLSFLDALRALRRDLFTGEENYRNALWAMVGIHAALIHGERKPEKFTSTRPMIAELLDMRIEIVERCEGVLHSIDPSRDPFAGLTE